MSMSVSLAFGTLNTRMNNSTNILLRSHGDDGKLPVDPVYIIPVVYCIQQGVSSQNGHKLMWDMGHRATTKWRRQNTQNLNGSIPNLTKPVCGRFGMCQF